MSNPTAEETAIQKQLTEFVELEQQKMEFQSQVNTFTDMCWDKCIAKINNKLDKSEENCLGNCVERFFDVGKVKHLIDIS